MAKSLAVILLNYDHQDDTIKCIKALQKCKWESKPTFYLIDNSPKSTNVELFNNLDVEIKYFPQTNNGGFAKGINAGLRKALRGSADFFLIINPDVVVEADFPIILNNFQDDHVALVAPAIRHTQNKKVMYGLDGVVDWKYAKATHFNTPKIKNTGIVDAQFVTFACVILARKAVEAVGYLDERYFMYLEDVDYCLSVLGKKQKIILDPKIVVDHNTSSSFSRPTSKLPISFQSQIKFINKWLPLGKRIVPIIYHFFAYFYLYLLWTYHYAKNNRQQTHQS